jgi:hypothetical protein
LVELDLFECSKLRCVPDSIVDLPNMQTSPFSGFHKLENLLTTGETSKLGGTEFI